MKTRIISAAVGIVIFAAVLIMSTNLVLEVFYPQVLTVVLAILSAVAVYEILYNTKLVKNLVIVGLSVLYAVIGTVLFSVNSDKTAIILFFVYVAVLLSVSLPLHEKTTPAELVTAQGYVMFLTFAFSSIDRLLKGYGYFAFILIFVFAWGSDTFAYFTGVFLGKHKLCPKLSPKKTVEGAIGGIVGCMVLTAITCLIFVKTNEFASPAVWALVAISPIFSVLSMVGDISASYIKRHAGIKDYGNIMPGHGGVLDRFDSVLFISPLLYGLMYLFPSLKI